MRGPGFTLPVQSEYISQPIYETPYEQLFALGDVLNQRASQAQLLEDQEKTRLAKIRESTLSIDQPFVDEESKRILSNVDKTLEEAGYNPADIRFQNALRVAGQQITGSEIFQSKLQSAKNYQDHTSKAEKLRSEGKFSEAEEYLRVNLPFEQYSQNNSSTSVFTGKNLYEWKDIAKELGDEIKINYNGQDYKVERSTADGMFYITTESGVKQIEPERVERAIAERLPELMNRYSDQFGDAASYMFGPQTYQPRAQRLMRAQEALARAQEEAKTGKGKKYQAAINEYMQLTGSTGPEEARYNQAWLQTYQMYQQALEQGDQTTAVQAERQLQEIDKMLYGFDVARPLIGERAFTRTSYGQTLQETALNKELTKKEIENRLSVSSIYGNLRPTAFQAEAKKVENTFRDLADGKSVTIREKEVSENEATRIVGKAGTLNLKSGYGYDKDTGKYYKMKTTDDPQAVLANMRKNGELDVLDAYAKKNGIDPSQYDGNATDMYTDLAKKLQQELENRSGLFNIEYQVTSTSEVGKNSPIFASVRGAVYNATHFLVTDGSGNTRRVSAQELAAIYNEANGTKFTPEQLKAQMTGNGTFNLITGNGIEDLNPESSGASIGFTLGNLKVAVPGTNLLEQAVGPINILDNIMSGKPIEEGKGVHEDQTTRITTPFGNMIITGNPLDGTASITYLNGDNEVVTRTLDSPEAVAEFNKNYVHLITNGTDGSLSISLRKIIPEK